jgi:hypothetical protein
LPRWLSAGLGSGQAAGVDPVIVSGARHGSGVVIDHPELLAQIVAFAAKAAA